MLVGTCPYYLYDKGEMLFCEGATIKYPDKGSKKKCMESYCCNEECGYKNCSHYKIMEDYYRRLYDGEEIRLFAKHKYKESKIGRPSKFSGG